MGLTGSRRLGGQFHEVYLGIPGCDAARRLNSTLQGRFAMRCISAIFATALMVGTIAAFAQDHTLLQAD
jgi:hypothetical protein